MLLLQLLLLLLLLLQMMMPMYLLSVNLFALFNGVRTLLRRYIA